jgi:hypothetical protein
MPQGRKGERSGHSGLRIKENSALFHREVSAITDEEILLVYLQRTLLAKIGI